MYDACRIFPTAGQILPNTVFGGPDDYHDIASSILQDIQGDLTARRRLYSASSVVAMGRYIAKYTGPSACHGQFNEVTTLCPTSRWNIWLCQLH